MYVFKASRHFKIKSYFIHRQIFFKGKDLQKYAYTRYY